MINEIVNELNKKGFWVWQRDEGIISCFDILAKRDEEIFIIKIYKFIETVTKNNAVEMKNLAAFLYAYLIVLAEYSKDGKLKDGVLYSRYEVPVVTPKTFKGILNGEYPLFYSTRGNYCAEIDREVFLEIKNLLNLTLDDIAEMLNVSKQAIYRYEVRCRIPENVVEKFLEIFGNNVVKRREISKNTKIQPVNKHPLSKKLFELGFITWEGQAAFDILAINPSKEKNFKKEDKNFIVVCNDIRAITKKIISIERIVEIIPGICICVSRQKPKDKENVKFIKEEDILNVKTKKEFVEMIKN